ncbi:MAG TPA: FMN-binding negative transcriptional regulator [Ktedonobacterales bacterium]
MLIRPQDAARDDDEWRAFLLRHDFGQIIASGVGRPSPVIVPAHFIYDGDTTISLHLARVNPLWAALAENPIAVLAVIGAYTFIPGPWNTNESDGVDYGVPTSYYASVQATGTCEIVDEPEALATLLSAQMAHFQPEGGHSPVTPGDTPYGRRLPAIRGLRLTVTEVRAKFKFGGNKPAAQRAAIAEKLAARGQGLDAEARELLLRRMDEKTPQ